jgi:hypothetical protein
MARDPFDEYFRRMMKHFFKSFEELEKEFEFLGRKWGKEPSGFILRRPGGIERRGGFSISISSDGKGPPKVEVKRFGPSGKWEKVPLERKGIVPTVGIPEEKPLLKREEPALPEVKEKLIPEYNVSVDIREVTIVLNAEGVEKKDNVRIKFYPESVEIYAAAPKLGRGYFCTVAVPASVDDERTTVEVEKDRVIIKIPRRLPTA